MGRSSAISPDQFTTFGELLKYLRRRAGLTQRELSIAVGYSDTQISRMEQNQRIPDQATLTAQFVPALDLKHEPEWTARLLELAAKARHDEAPALHPSGSPIPQHNLPFQLTSFIGREKEIVEAKRLLAPLSSPGRGVGGEGRSRLVTLTGSGGTGKTRLALQGAAQLLNSFPDGVWLVELAPLADSSLVPQAVATGLGVRDRPGYPILRPLIDYLREKCLLLLMDNCEHLVEACAQLAEALLQACPNLHILATSRETLGIAGETVFPVPPLSTPDPRQSLPIETLRPYEAVRLFVERAATVLPGFTMTNENAPAIAQVCHQLDGIPLALELAAARVKTLKVEQIANRLADAFHLLTGGSRTALPRHQTLKATIDWSYRLLSEPERVLLRRLSVFAGEWSLEAAETVVGQEDSLSAAVLDVLTQLVNKSLIIVEREQGMEARYRLLETIRQYAAEKLRESGEAEQLRQRHCDWFLGLAERAEPELLRGRDQVSWLNRLEAEHDNLRTALDWSLETDQIEMGMRLAVALWKFWDQGYYQEGRDWLEAGLAQRGRLPKALLAQTLRATGRLASRQNDLDLAEAYGAESVALFRELGDKANLARAVRALAATIFYQGDIERCEPYDAENLALCRELGDKWGIAQALADVGWDKALLGDYDGGISLMEESLALERELEDTAGIALSAHALGMSRLLHGEADEAAKLFRESLTLAHQLNSKWLIGGCLGGLAGAASVRRQPVRAAKLWGVSDQLGETTAIMGGVNSYWVRYIEEPILAPIRTQLDEAVFETAYAEGRAMTLEQAIAYGLEELATDS